MLSLYVESQEWQETECCHYMWNHKSGKILNVVIIYGITRVARDWMLSLYVESQELQETECCHYMWNHKSGKRLNVVIICGITRVARD